jgi:hypothetical protein
VGTNGATIRLTAYGGRVSWTIAVIRLHLGHVSVTPSSGTLASGQSVTVHVKIGLLATGDLLTISPGGLVFTLLASLG